MHINHNSHSELNPRTCFPPFCVKLLCFLKSQIFDSVFGIVYDNRRQETRLAHKYLR